MSGDLTVAEVARALGCSEPKVRRLIRSGQLSATNTAATSGRPTYTVSRSALAAFKRARKVVAA